MALDLASEAAPGAPEGFSGERPPLAADPAAAVGVTMGKTEIDGRGARDRDQEVEVEVVAATEGGRDRVSASEECPDSRDLRRGPAVVVVVAVWAGEGGTWI